MDPNSKEWTANMANSVRNNYLKKKARKATLIALNSVVVIGLVIGLALPTSETYIADSEALMLETFLDDQIHGSLSGLDSSYADLSGAYW